MGEEEEDSDDRDSKERESGTDSQADKETRRIDPWMDSPFHLQYVICVVVFLL